VTLSAGSLPTAARPGRLVYVRLGSFARLVLCLVAAWVSATASHATAAGDAHRYRLGTGDTVRIEVVGENDMTAEARVSDQGTISYWLLGDLKVVGLTVDGVERLITDRLKGGYLVDPRVRVTVADYRPFYVLGAVNKPGGYSFLPGLTVRQAISLAGGFTERASHSKIYVVRAGDKSEERKRLNLNDAVFAGDTITVEESFF
jgi:protein involved in polysaccharide export with SLBB domain